MKTEKEIQKELGRLREDDQEMIRNTLTTLKKILEDKLISEVVMNQLEACENDIRLLRERTTRKIIALLKVGNLLD